MRSPTRTGIDGPAEPAAGPSDRWARRAVAVSSAVAAALALAAPAVSWLNAPDPAVDRFRQECAADGGRLDPVLGERKGPGGAVHCDLPGRPED